MLQKIHAFLFKNTSNKQVVLKNTFWLFLAEAISKGSIAIVIVLIGRLLGTELFGQYNYLNIILTFILIFADFGITQLTIRDRQHLDEIIRPHRLREGLSTKFILSIGVIIIYLIILFFTATNSFLWTVGIMLLLQGIANSFLEYLRATFRSLQRSEIETKIKLRQGIGNFLLIAVVYLTHSLPRTLFGQAIITILTCIYARSITENKHGLDSLLPETLPMKIDLIKNGWIFAISGLFVSMYYYVDSLMIQRFWGYEAVGIYNAAYLFIIYLTAPLIVINKSLFPKIRNLYKTQQIPAIKKLIKNINMFTIGIYILLVTILLYFIKPITLFIFGIAYTGSIEVSKILLITVVITSGYISIAAFLNSTGHQKWHLYATLFGLIINIILNFLFIPKYGYTVAAYTTVITEIVACSIMYWKYYNVISIKE